MYNEESFGKNKASEQQTRVCKIRSSIQTILKVKPCRTDIPLSKVNKFQQRDIVSERKFIWNFIL